MSIIMRRFIIAIGIVFAAFTLIAFLVPFFVRNGVFWLAYLFAALAIVAQLYIQPKAFSKGDSIRSKFYGFPIARVGVIYLVAQIILSVVFMVLSPIAPIWLELLVFLLLLALAALGVIATDSTRDEVEQLDAKLKKSVVAMRTLQSKANSLINTCDNEQVNKEITSLSEKFRYSDPVSSEATIEIENEINNAVDELQAAVMEKDHTSALTICNTVDRLLTERNRLCKLNK